MPRIDPQQLLKCLSVLLSPNGGIKSQDEVQRLASLMTKFSKKLVSKCIYVSILKATETHLLVMFMSAGGWDLTYTWLSDGVTSKNWPLVKELVDLLLMCPVDIDRLKTNACPKLIKTLSKDPSAEENVRLLACKLVEQWLRIVRGDSDYSDKSMSTLPSATIQPLATSSSDVPTQSMPYNSTDPTIQDQDDNNFNSDNNSGGEIKVENDSLEETGDEHLPVYKITIRDGNKVLAEISGDRRSSTEGPEEDCSTGTEDIIQDNEDHVEDESEDEDLIKPVKLSKKHAGKSKKQNATKLPSKLHSNNKKERDSTDSSSSDRISNRKKDSVKQPIKKKVDIAKSKVEVKTKGNLTVKDPVLNKDREESTVSKPRGKFNLSLKNRKNIFSKDKESKLDKTEVKEKNAFEDSDSLTDKEKETLSKFITPPISKVGKIPKKSNLNKEDNKNIDIKSRSPKEENESGKTDMKKNIETKRPEIKRLEKKYSISVEPKKTVLSDRPKTVKTFNSKFRSTGLEEDVKPPPPRTTIPKKLPLPLASTVSDKKLGKRSSPPPDNHLPEKRPKPESPQEDKKSMDKIGGIKLIPPKPKPMFLQESDVFMDAMLAANTMKEPRKRKRRGSTSKDSSQSEAKKEATGSNSPMHSPRSEEASPSCVKPTFKFYQDTLDTSTEEDRSSSKMDESLEFAEPDQNPEDDQKSISSEDDKPGDKVEGPNGPVKGVLVHLKSKRQKKSVSWKEDSLECIKYFELDETERVNVTKNFADMKNMEREHERENFQIARKLAVDDVMEERMRWRALIPIDIAATIVAPGKNSQEKDIQYAREKTTPAAIYFNKRAIPDAPGEPDLEIHATTDPTCIPLDDITGSTDSINDFTSTPWPEPRGQPPPPPPPVQPPVGPFQPPPGPGSGPVPGPVPFPQGPFPPMGPFMPGPPGPGMPMPPAGDCWRTGDGKVLPMPPEMMMPPQGMMPPGMPGMPPGPMMMPPGVPPDMPFPMMPGPGPNPTPEEMAQFAGGFPPMGPAPPQMFGPGPPGPPPPGPQGGNWQGGGGGGGWYQENDQGPPPGSGPGRYQGNNWRGGRGGNRNPDNWNPGGNSRTPICNNFLKRGFCRNNSCRFRHPRN